MRTVRWTLIKKGKRELWAHKSQYILLIVILGMGIGMYTSMFDFMGTREITMHAIDEESRFMDVEITTQYGVLLNQSTAETMIMHSAVRDNILAIEYRMIVDVYIDHTYHDSQKLTKGLLYGYDYRQINGETREIEVNRPLFFDEPVTSFFSKKELSCYLEVHFAKYYGITPGDTINIIKDNSEKKITVLEIINVPDFFEIIPEGTLFPAPDALGVMVVPIETCYMMMDLPEFSSLINNMVIRVTDDADIDFISEELTSTFQAASVPVSVRKGEDNPAWSTLMDDLEGDRAFMGMFPGIIFIISGIGLVLALRRMVRAHRPQIGIFKALGVPNSTILLYFLIIGLIIACCSILLGFMLSIPLKILLNGLMDELLLFAVRAYATYPEYYFYAAVIAIVLCCSCTLLPAGCAVREKPIDVIQKREGIKKVKVKKHRNSRIHHDFPVPLKMVGRDISRKPVRTLTTMFGVALSLALFLSVVIMFDSFFVFLDNTKAVNSWDYEVSVSGFTPMSYARDWRNDYPSITYVNPGLRLPVNVTKHGQYVNGLFYGLDDLSRSLQLGVEYPFGDGIFISQYIADELGVGVGDFVNVEILRLKEGYRFSLFTTELEVLGIHENPMGIFLYGNLRTLYRLTDLDGFANFYLVHTDGVALPSSDLNAIAQTNQVIAITYVKDQATYLDQMFDLIIGFIFMMILISVVLAIAIVYNLFKVGAIEKSREYATMKTLGTSKRRISYLIFIEALVTLVGGVSFGAIGGYYMSYVMLVGNELLEGIAMEVVFSWTGLLLGAGVLAGVVVLVSFLTIRFIDKIVIADVIRDRSTG